MTLTFAAVCFLSAALPASRAQQTVELPEVKGSHSLVYQGLKIEIVRIHRTQRYQGYWANSSMHRGPEFIAEEGYELAVVYIQTERLSARSGISVNQLVLVDLEGREYLSAVQSFSIGAGSERQVHDPEVHDYEFPVMVPQGTRFTAVQLRRHIYREDPPSPLPQKITFELGRW